jgi:hypothetical protein
MAAKIIPVIVGSGALLFGTLALINEVFKLPVAAAPAGADLSPAEAAGASAAGSAGAGQHGRHMDVGSRLDHLDRWTIIRRGACFFLWMVGFMVSMSIIGWIPSVPIFIAAFMRVEGRERWRTIAIVAGIMTLLIYGVFDQLLEIPWLPSWLGTTFPNLKFIPSV